MCTGRLCTSTAMFLSVQACLFMCQFSYLLSVQIHSDVVGGLAAHGKDDPLRVLQVVDVHHHLDHQVNIMYLQHLSTADSQSTCYKDGTFKTLPVRKGKKWVIPAGSIMLSVHAFQSKGRKNTKKQHKHEKKHTHTHIHTHTPHTQQQSNGEDSK